MYSLRVVGSTEALSEKLDILSMLAGRKAATPKAWEEVMSRCRPSPMVEAANARSRQDYVVRRRIKRGRTSLGGVYTIFAREPTTSFMWTRCVEERTRSRRKCAATR